MLQKLTQLFQSIWNEGKVPQQFKDATIVHIYKRKGNRQSCDNHRGISLLSIAGKILARLLLIASYSISNKILLFFQKVSVASGQVEEQWT